jgi:hypothetical protein
MLRAARSAVALAAMSGAISQARDIHVSNLSGDDRASGAFAEARGPKDGPVRTIAKALRLADTSDRIILANTGQPYRENISLTGAKHSGTRERPFMLQGSGAILDGSAPVPQRAWEHVSGNVFRFIPAWRAQGQFFVDDRPAHRRPTDRWAVSLPALEPREWCLWQGHVYFRVEEGKPPQAYRTSYTALQTGVTLYHVRHVAIANLTVQGFAIDGLAASDAVSDAAVFGLVARGNGRSGLSITGASRLELLGATLGDNGAAQLLTADYSRGWIFDSQLIGNTAPATDQRGGRLWIDGEEVFAGVK